MWIKSKTKANGRLFDLKKLEGSRHFIKLVLKCGWLALAVFYETNIHF